MKKIISAVLLVTCLFALCSCSVLSKIPVIGGLFGGVSAFEKAIDNTNPSNAYIETSAETSMGTLKANYEIIYAEDGSAVIKYSYEKFNEIGAEEEKSTIKGTINRAADGTYSRDVKDTDVSSIAGGIALNLSEIKSDAITVNDAGDVLTATVAADSTEAVFGKAIAKDVDLEITIKNNAVSRIIMTYEGASIICNYE